MKLISMTDYVLNQNETETFDTSQIMWYDKEVSKLDKIRNYAKFLKQPLELWMFVPCHEDGNALVNDNLTEYDREMYFEEEKKFQQAKERCLFEGFSITKNDSRHIRIKKGEVSMIFFIESNLISFYDMFCESHDIFTIEDLVKYNLQLTQTAIKKLGL